MSFSPRYVALILWAVGVGLALAVVIVTLMADWHGVPTDLRPSSSSTAGTFTVTVMASVGLLIALRRPDNPIGWIMMIASIFGDLIDFPKLYLGLSLNGHLRLPGPLWLFWFSQLAWIFVFCLLLVVLPILFPDGKLISRRWLIPIVLSGGLVVLVLLQALDPRSTAPYPNPAAVPALSGVNAFGDSLAFAVLFLLILASGMASLVVRYWRGGEQQRQQVKWLLAAGVALLLVLMAQFFIPALQLPPLTPLAVGLLPIAIGIAVLRYRLFDIDFIINKALVYGGLAVLITAAYALVVIGIGALVGSSRQLLLSIVTTLLIAVSFQPLRQRTQRLANQLVYGKRSTPYETLSRFSEHLSEAFSQDHILDQMTRLLAENTGAERAEVWLRVGPNLLLGSAAPADRAEPTQMPMVNGTLPPMERDAVVPVTHQGELLGALTVLKKRGETMRPVEQKLLNDLAGQAGLVLNNVRLNRELLARLEELSASRQRLVTVQDAERRRFERDLHDGAQQHLVALKVKIGLAESATEPGTKVHGMLGQLKQDADAALETMRELARGIYPPLLASEGLPTALRAHARRLAIPVELDLGDVPRQPREVEGGVYFCCLEALQNVSKYAEATSVRLHLWTEANQLRFAIEDNGKGFDPSALKTTSGMQNMRDRLEALGGTLSVRSRPGAGTTVEGKLPLASAVSAPSLA